MKSNLTRKIMKSFSFYVDSALILNYGLEALNKIILQNNFIKLFCDIIANILGVTIHGNFRTNVIKR